MPITQDKETALLDRFSYAAIAEAGRLLDEGVASAKDIDLAMRAGAGVKVGPLEQADAIGLDAVLDTLRTMHAKYGENYKPSATLEQLVAKGMLGKKTGRGFLEYS